MVKSFIHLLRTYLITFRYLQKCEISTIANLSMLVVFGFIFLVSYGQFVGGMF